MSFRSSIEYSGIVESVSSEKKSARDIPNPAQIFLNVGSVGSVFH